MNQIYLSNYLQMEKLIELLNEYENTLEPNEQMVRTKNGVKATSLVIISKQYGFIKWLVENEKIDVKELEKSDRPFDVGYATDETLYERVVMLLSIQDEPIEFLVSILK